MKTLQLAPTRCLFNSIQLNLLLVLILWTCFSNCKNYKILKYRSYSQIELLKDQALLVRLNTSQHTIDALKKANKGKEAGRIEEKAAGNNRKAIEGFKNHYTFSKVYFFYSSEADLLKNRQFDQVKLFDSNLQPITDLSFLRSGYLVAAFGTVYHDQIYQRTKDNVRYAVAGTNGMPALVLLDGDYIQLNKPFPFRVLLHSNKDYQDEAITSLNNNLSKYYKKMERKKRKQNWAAREVH